MPESNFESLGQTHPATQPEIKAVKAVEKDYFVPLPVHLEISDQEIEPILDVREAALQVNRGFMPHGGGIVDASGQIGSFDLVMFRQTKEGGLLLPLPKTAVTKSPITPGRSKLIQEEGDIVFINAATGIVRLLAQIRRNTGFVPSDAYRTVHMPGSMMAIFTDPMEERRPLDITDVSVNDGTVEVKQSKSWY